MANSQLEVFSSLSLSTALLALIQDIFHHLTLNHLDLPLLIMAIPPALHVFETFSSYEDYDTYDAAVLQPMI